MGESVGNIMRKILETALTASESKDRLHIIRLRKPCPTSVTSIAIKEELAKIPDLANACILLCDVLAMSGDAAERFAHIMTEKHGASEATRAMCAWCGGMLRDVVLFLFCCLNTNEDEASPSLSSSRQYDRSFARCLGYRQSHAVHHSSSWDEGGSLVVDRNVGNSLQLLLECLLGHQFWTSSSFWTDTTGRPGFFVLCRLLAWKTTPGETTGPKA